MARSNGNRSPESGGHRGVEQHGADFVPEAERYSTPRNQAGVFIGAQMCFNLVVLGWLPISYGLGWWDALGAITVGLAIGSLGYAPYALFGARTGTNSAVSSGAHFGVLGRLVGTLLTFFIALGFFALVIWTGGDALVGGISRLTGVEAGDGARVLGYAVVGVASVVIAVYGHDKVASAQKVVVVLVGGLLLVGVFAIAPQFDAGYSGGAYVLGSFWPTWLLGVVTAVAVPVSYAPFANDYSRYISLKSYSSRSIAIANGAGLFVGCWLVMSFGAFEGAIFGTSLGPVLGLVEGAPLWFVVPIIVIGVIGPLSHGALCLYGTGIDAASLVRGVPRSVTTAVLGLIGIALVFLGAFVWDAIDAFQAFVILFTLGTAPWMVINLIGYAWRRGWYDPHDLQVLYRGERGGRYWFTAGWNLRALIAWALAVGAGLLTSHTSLFTGPWFDVAGGVDVSVPVAAVIGGAGYLVAILIVPEDPAVRGGAGLDEAPVPEASAMSAPRHARP
jgi:purine-cytosine permease-like protein